MSIFDLLKQSLVGREIKVFKRQEYNDRSHKNGKPAHFFTYHLREPVSIFSFNQVTEEKMKIKDVKLDCGIRFQVILENGETTWGSLCFADEIPE